MREPTHSSFSHSLNGQSRATKRFLGFLLRTRHCLNASLTTRSRALITIRSGSLLEQSHRLQKGDVIIINAPSMSTVPQMKNSNKQKTWFIALTSKTTSATSCANSDDSEKRTNILSKRVVYSCVSETR